MNRRWVRGLCLLLLGGALLAAGCGGGGGTSPDPAQGSNWDEMQWDQGSWA